MVQEDMSAAICTSISEGGKKVGTQDAGWLHVLVRDANPRKYKAPPKKFKPERLPNWNMLVRNCQNNLLDLSGLSKELGVTANSLSRLEVGWFRKCYTFPMKDGNNRFIGIRMRAKKGKFAIPGSKNAIFWPLGVLADSKNTLYISEGPTDTAALLDLGFDAIGRASCNTGFAYIKQMIEHHRRAVVIVGDKDEAKKRLDGSLYWPGHEGALILAKDLKPFVRSVKVIKPAWYKDVREWVRNGATRTKIELIVKETAFI